MKLSDNTINILKNFAEINPSVLFKPGNTIRTISAQKSVLANAIVDEEFPTTAGVFDLGKFLATISLFDNPDIDFQEKRFVIKNARSKVAYTYTDENMIVVPPPEPDASKLPKVFASVSLKWDDIQHVKKASGILKLTEIAFIGDGETLSLSTIDSKNPTADQFDLEIGKLEHAPFRLVIKTDNMKMVAADYVVDLSTSMVHFKSPKVRYWVAVESSI